ncbi:hypothetical protein F4818DRAFT_171299 [Hypoxylon cercidicola]|nr:hypothetical protein F4818DRAFT_171299 [Hypoxylon cercidicola]
MALTEQNHISIAQIVIYVPSLLIAILLAIRHGIGRSSGWLYLIIFSLARLIGPSLQLATISDPTNIRLRIGAAILQNIGLSPLIMVQLSLIGRALGSIRKSTNPLVTEKRVHLIHLLALVGLVLGSIGGSNSGTNFGKTGTYTVSGLTQAGTGLFIAAYVLLVISTILVATQISDVEPGEKRLVLAVGLSLPFILVRLVYSAESVYGHNPSFSQLTGNVNIQLGMAVIMEMIVVAICESIGMTLKKLPKIQAATHPEDGGYQQPSQQTEGDHEMGGYK